VSGTPRAIVNPIDVISAARRRIATLAATRAAVRGLLPSLVAMTLAVTFAAISNSTWLRWGYALSPEIAWGLRASLFAGAIAGLIVSTFAALRAFRAQAFAVAAAEVDRIVAAKEEILTLALLSDPIAKTGGQERSRSSLYPILWRRAAEKLYRFDPSTAFRLAIVPSIRSGLFASLAIVVLLVSFLSLSVRPISPLSDAARHMLETADNLERSGSGSAETKALADRLREAAKALNNPTTPREDKLEQIAAISQELERRQKPQSYENKQQANGNSAGNQSTKNQSGSGSGQANGDKGGKSGPGSGGSANGEGTASEPGAGSKQAGNDESARNPPNQSDSNDNGKKADAQIAELSKDLQKDQQKLEAHDPKSTGQAGGGNDQNQKENSGNAPRAGQNRNQSGSQKPGTGPGQASGGQSGPKESHSVASSAGKPNGDQARNDSGGTSGDTHLGQFPSPGRYERFYQPGEKGEPLEIKDARYVLFRIPPASALDGSGKIVMDTDRPTASTPYTNSPLKDERLSATPDERQLIPPRYRDLLR
jgi:hypothetical protein